MRGILVVFFCLCFGCSSQEELEKLRSEYAQLQKKLEKTETKLEIAYRESVKSRLPDAIWLEGNSEVKVNQGYIQSIQFDIFGNTKQTFMTKYFPKRDIKPNYYIHFYNRFGKCVGVTHVKWLLRHLDENTLREDKTREIDGLLESPAFFTVTFVK